MPEEKLWYIYSRNPTRYQGNVVSDAKEIFRWMERVSSSANLMAIGEDTMTTESRKWIEEYRSLLPNTVMVPGEFFKAVTAQQSFQKWVKTRA